MVEQTTTGALGKATPPAERQAPPQPAEPGAQFTRESPAGPTQGRDPQQPTPAELQRTPPRQGGATFAQPAAPAAGRNGPIYRFSPPLGGQGGSLEVGLLDGLVTITVHPDNGKPASVRLPANIGRELQEALARADLR